MSPATPKMFMAVMGPEGLELLPRPDREFPADLGSDISRMMASDLAPTQTGVLFRSDGVGLLYPGQYHLISGKPHSGKTLFVNHLAREAVIQGLQIIWIDYEMGAYRTANRMVQVGLTPFEAELFFRHLYAPPDTDAAVPAIAAHRPDLVVIDSVDQMMLHLKLDPDGTGDATAFYSRVINPLKRHGITIVAIDHLSIKTSPRQTAGPMGNTKKYTDADVSFRLTVREQPAPGRRGSLSLSVDKDRDGSLLAVTGPRTGLQVPLATVVIDSNPETKAIRIVLDPPSTKNQSAPLGLGVKEWQALEYISANEPVRVIDLGRHLEGPDVPDGKQRNSGNNTVKRLKKKGQIVSSGDGYILTPIGREAVTNTAG